MKRKLSDRQAWYKKHNLNEGNYMPTNYLRFNKGILEQKFEPSYMDFTSKWVPVPEKFTGPYED